MGEGGDGGYCFAPAPIAHVSTNVTRYANLLSSPSREPVVETARIGEAQSCAPFPPFSRHMERRQGPSHRVCISR